MESEARILRPRPRHAIQITPASSSSGPSTPATSEDAPNNHNNNLDISSSAEDKDGTGSFFSVSRNQSIRNLTSPALLSIYSPTAFEGSNTPWETGANTPSLRANGPRCESGVPVEDVARKMAALRYREATRPHLPRKHGFRGYVLPLMKRTVLLFVFGVVYGVIVSHLHHANPRLTPITTADIVDSWSWQYMASWGAAGVALGSLLPWFDGIWGSALGGGGDAQGQPRGWGNADGSSSSSSRAGALDWSPMVRSIGAFVGIAFAIRKVPWQSTLQVSLTLALANPVLWYLLDRSKPGFIFSSTVCLTGMGILLNINPEIFPSPVILVQSPEADHPLGGLQLRFWQGDVSHEGIAVATWIASVLFCSCVCFGNIGRRLAS